MKKIIALLITVSISNICIIANAETIHTNNAAEYSDALYEINNLPLAIAEDDTEDITSKTLLVSYSGELDDETVLYDIYDEYNIHTLVYPTVLDCDAAYEYYTENNIPVVHDQNVKLEDDNSISPASLFLSWGPDSIGTSIFTEKLTNYYGSTASMPDVYVAIIDSGVAYTHPFLSNRVDYSLGYDFYNNDSNANDDNSHGTHVAGIIADNTLSNVHLIPLKITNASGNTSTSYVKSAIQFANELGVDVINMSLGSDSEMTSTQVANTKSIFDSIFTKAISNGTIICVAAGNSTANANNAEYIFPAFMEEAITVANATQAGYTYAAQNDFAVIGGISSSSNYGSVIDIAAPGTSIYSTILNDKYGYKSGTSMATPFVSAAASLLKTRNTSIEFAEATVELQDNSIELMYDSQKSLYFGKGLLNLSAVSVPTPTEEPTLEPTKAPNPTPTPMPTATPTATPMPTMIPDVEITNESLGTSRVSFTVTALNDVIKNGAEVFAVGYKNNELICMSNQITLTDSASVDLIFNEHTQAEFDEVKIFVWNSLTEGKPLCKSYKVR